MWNWNSHDKNVLHRRENNYRIYNWFKMSNTFIHRCSRPVLVCIATLLLVSVVLPIGYTPFKVFVPRYNTWHSLSTIHLMKIFMFPVPDDVTPLESCKSIHPSVIKQPSIDTSHIRFYNKSSALKKRLEQIEPSKSTNLEAFMLLMDKETKLKLIYTYRVMATALARVGIEHVVLHGSLLGLYRFSAIQPWDDDMDVGINISKWYDVREVLSCIDGFELYLDPTMRWSFFASNATRSETMPHKNYPFVDIFFYGEDETHVWGINPVNRHRSIFPKSEMFPYGTALLEGMTIPVPFDYKAILKRQYGDISICANQLFSHYRARSVKDEVTVEIPCSDLFVLYGQFGDCHD